MPSFWKILCFSNHKYGSKNNTTSQHSRERDKFRRKPRSEPFQTEDINDNHGHFPVPDIEDDTVNNVTKASQRGLIDESKAKKRRRVQEIFNIESRKDNSYALFSEKKFGGYNSGRTSGGFEYASHTPVNRLAKQRDFGGGFTPHMCHQNTNSNVDSMYRYVPKAVQNVYASKVLEGKQMDDFFNRLHRESSMTHFASKPLQLANEIVMQSPSRGISRHVDDKTSLIPQTEIETGSDILGEEMDTDDDYNGNGLLNMAPRSRALNTNFEQIWNSTGEVLY